MKQRKSYTRVKSKRRIRFRKKCFQVLCERSSSKVNDRNRIPYIDDSFSGELWSNPAVIIALIELETVAPGRAHPELKELVGGNAHHTKYNIVTQNQIKPYSANFQFL